VLEPFHEQHRQIRTYRGRKAAATLFWAAALIVALALFSLLSLAACDSKSDNDVDGTGGDAGVGSSAELDDGGDGDGVGGTGGGGSSGGIGGEGDGSGDGESSTPDNPDDMGEVPVYSPEVQDQLNQFQRVVEELPMDDISSARGLLAAFRRLASADAPNNALFLSYEEAMQSVSEGINSNYEEGAPDDQTINDALENGFYYMSDEEQPYFILRPDFFCDTFSSYVDESIQLLLELRKKHYEFAGGHDFIENNTIMVSMDQLAEMIVDWENYQDRYPDVAETEDIADSVDYYLKVYIGSIQVENSGFYYDVGMDENGNQILKLADEPTQSYLKFTENYADSAYCPVIAGLYEIYKRNNFLYTNDIWEYFIAQGLDAPY